MIDELLKRKCRAKEANGKVPDTPGYYAIFVDGEHLPDRLQKYKKCVVHRSGLLYIGIATKSLQNRLVRQELQCRGAATFFRSLGAILGYRPKRSSLQPKGKNYSFTPNDRVLIAEWMREHLWISWVEGVPCKKNEKKWIAEYRPPINIQHNPNRCQELMTARKVCLQEARGIGPGGGKASIPLTVSDTRTLLSLADDFLTKAQAITGISDNAALMAEVLRVLNKCESE